jgi:hypothetical protein
MKTNLPSNPELLKLLALKRYEQPPPGYFEDFSFTVIARLQAEPLPQDRSLWQAFWSRFELRPMWGSLAACGLVLCALSFFQVLGGDSVPMGTDNLQLGMLPAMVYQAGLTRAENPIEAAASSVAAILPEDSSGLRVNGMWHKASFRGN